MKKEYMIYLDGKFGKKPKVRFKTLQAAIAEANRVLIRNNESDNEKLSNLASEQMLILEIIGAATIDENGTLALESAVD